SRRDPGAGRRCARPGLLNLHLGEDGRRDQKQQSAHILHFRFSFSCSSRQRILPVAVFGSASTNSTRRGALKAAIFSRAQSMMSFDVVFFEAFFRTMTALTVSPRYSSRAPITHASWIAGWA